MRSTLAALATTACLLGLMPSARAGDQDFSLVNKTGYQIDNLYVSRHSSRNWGQEIMGRNAVLEDGDTYEVNFPRNAQACHYDLKVAYHDGTEAVWNDLDLCSISTVTLFYDRRNNTTRARTE